MSVAASAITVGTWLAVLAGGAWAVSTPDVRAWVAGASGRAWARRLGALAAILSAGATGAFFVHPPLGVYSLVVAGALSYVAGLFAAVNAAETAFAAVAPEANNWRRVRAFWCAAGVYHRGTRRWFGVALVAFLLAALVAALSADAFVSAAGAVALGGVLACVVSLTAVGVFVPVARTETVTEAVEGARS